MGATLFSSSPSGRDDENTEQKPVFEQSLPMNLPIPNAQEVQKFAAFYEREFGVVLSAEEAREASTRLLQLFYLGTYGLKTQARELHPKEASTKEM